ncbi:hypothetical protein SCHPADRAFT_536579 [Schizopora paradoxa]|uniref:2OGFeDO JBP1/TET oxygenase domain-containing protein n=1 Tax=Schizopora paradoxa TaxID=27342 RepID=A0A0H2RE36_9AGAM|nr:hypothetical protein SCHPADRAFT_536579 [Schizopora paradoxa]
MWSIIDEETGRPPNQTQLGPHFDQDFIYHQEECDKLLEVLQPMLTFVQDASKISKDVYKSLEIVAETLPLHSALPFYPFTGMAFNVSVSTTGHRDTMDLSVCAVLALGDWKGGHLCLHELGLALDLQCGDLVIFRSDILTHFNLPHYGTRYSVVLSTDKGLQTWARDRCGHDVNT